MKEPNHPVGLRLVTLPRRRRASAAAMLLESAQQVTLALWIGSLAAVSGLAVPALLRGMDDPIRAARCALELIGQVAVLGCGAACFLLLSTLLMYLLSMRSAAAAGVQAGILVFMAGLAVGAQLLIVPSAAALLRGDPALFTRGAGDPAFVQFRWFFGARLAVDLFLAILGTGLLLTGVRRWSRSDAFEEHGRGRGTEDRSRPLRG